MGETLLAKVFYQGTLNGKVHTVPKTGNSYTFAGPNVPVKVYDMDDVNYFSNKNHFKVVMEEGLVEDIEVPGEVVTPPEDPEPVKDETPSEVEGVEETKETEEEPKPKKKASKSKKKKGDEE